MTNTQKLFILKTAAADTDVMSRYQMNTPFDDKQVKAHKKKPKLKSINTTEEKSDSVYS